MTRTERQGGVGAAAAQGGAVADLLASYKAQWQSHFSRETATLDRFIEDRNKRIKTQRLEGDASSSQGILLFSKDDFPIRPRPHSAFGREIEKYFQGNRTFSQGLSEEEMERYFQAVEEPKEYEEMATAKAAEDRHLEAQDKREQAELAHEKQRGWARVGTAWSLMQASDEEVDTSLAHFFLQSNEKVLEKRAAHLAPVIAEIEQRIQEGQAFLDQMSPEEKENYWNLYQNREDVKWAARIMFPANVLQAAESFVTVGTLVSPMGRGAAEGSRQVMKFLSSASKGLRNAERNLTRMSRYISAKSGGAASSLEIPGKTREAFSQFESVIQETGTQFIQGAERQRAIDALGLEVPKFSLTLPYSGGRNVEGIAHITKPLINPEKLMRGSQMNAGHIPLEVAKMMEGKTFKSFDEFRREFWKNMAKSQYAQEFGDLNILRMKDGLSPFSIKSQHLGKQKTYHLHHKTPISQGGAVYDMANILISTPKYHKEILQKSIHFGENL
ncbi:MAG: HNH endonuclease [Proteobacteria bacterium]|nr:HNH endonuclease [Pseudomonadota bacterium]